ncbi:hypothetical protein IFM89_017961 [Coptis chinensis]|uniref:Translocon-associated protein subunit alpha n=1 Tax=Coptis chinensis TaxID=261450 RepID=A0A835LRN2_9MAGN|nr:hypothetical protein IFM89_017961 [Coptis chinensis]
MIHCLIFVIIFKCLIMFRKLCAIVPAGEEAELLVGLNNKGESTVNVIAIKASLHLPFDHCLLVQNLTVREFNDATVPLSTQATFPSIFAVRKFLQLRTFDLGGSIIYEIDQTPHQSVFYNGTIEVVEASGFISIKSVFLFTLGVALLIGLGGLWIYGKYKTFPRKQRGHLKWKLALELLMPPWMNGCRMLSSQRLNPMFLWGSPYSGLTSSSIEALPELRPGVDNIVNQIDTKKQYQLDLDKIVNRKDTRTTLMIKNTPTKYTSKMLLAAIDENHKGTYDFLYLPIDFKCNTERIEDCDAPHNAILGWRCCFEPSNVLTENYMIPPAHATYDPYRVRG